MFHSEILKIHPNFHMPMVWVSLRHWNPLFNYDSINFGCVFYGLLGLSKTKDSYIYESLALFKYVSCLQARKKIKKHFSKYIHQNDFNVTIKCNWKTFS